MNISALICAVWTRTERVCSPNMRLVALVVVCGLIAVQDAQRTRATGSVPSALSRRAAAEVLAEDPNLCFSLRENEDQRQLLCNDRRSKFNFNPFGLRFGKRRDNYVYRRAVKRARARTRSPLALFARDPEVPT